jgi:hypothetical protein
MKPVRVREVFQLTAPARLCLILLLPGLLACEPPRPEPPDQLTRRQKDSVVAQSRLPGARSVGKALEVLEASEDRAASIEAIR